jgi:hypothetical protein
VLNREVIFLPPNISPLPLAELFLSPAWDRYQLIIDTAPDAPMERKITQNVFVPNHFCGMVTTAYLRELAKTANFGIQHDPGLSLLMYLAELRTPSEVVDVDLRKFGWAVRRSYRYFGKDLNRYVGLTKEIDEPMDARTN